MGQNAGKCRWNGELQPLRLACPGNGNRTSRVLEVCALETWQTLLIAYPGLTLPLAGSCKVKSDGGSKACKELDRRSSSVEINLALPTATHWISSHRFITTNGSSAPWKHPKAWHSAEEGASSGFHVDSSPSRPRHLCCPREGTGTPMRHEKDNDSHVHHQYATTKKRTRKWWRRRRGRRKWKGRQPTP